MNIVEKAAYLKGLCDGLGIASDSVEGKLWSALNDLLADMAHEIEELRINAEDYSDALDEICEELAYLEEITCDLDEPFECPPGFEDSCEGCPAEGDCFLLGDLDEDDDDDEELEYDGLIYDVKCPKCGEELSFDEDTIELGFTECPCCGERLEFDFETEEEDD